MYDDPPPLVVVGVGCTTGATFFGGVFLFSVVILSMLDSGEMLFASSFAFRAK